jgi:hypothetical protein
MVEKTKSPSDLADKFMLRLPEGMRDEIRSAAKNSGRSMNSEIVHRLLLSFTNRAESFEWGTSDKVPPLPTISDDLPDDARDEIQTCLDVLKNPNLIHSNPDKALSFALRLSELLSKQERELKMVVRRCTSYAGKLGLYRTRATNTILRYGKLLRADQDKDDTND